MGGQRTDGREFDSLRGRNPQHCTEAEPLKPVLPAERSGVLYSETAPRSLDERQLHPCPSSDSESVNMSTVDSRGRTNDGDLPPSVSNSDVTVH